MSKQMMEKLYQEYQESRGTVSEDVLKARDDMCRAFEEYLNAVCEDEFRNAFMFGYAYGLKDAQVGKGESVCA